MQYASSGAPFCQESVHITWAVFTRCEIYLGALNSSVSHIYARVCLYKFLHIGYKKTVLRTEGKKKSNNESWEGARVTLHFLDCPLMFPAYALHGNREEEFNHNSITLLMIV